MPTLFRSELEKHVKTFLELVREAYQNVPALVRQEFGVEGEEVRSLRLVPLASWPSNVADCLSGLSHATAPPSVLSNARRAQDAAASS